MKFDLGSVKNRQKQLKSKMQGGFLRLVNGKNKIRILPWSVKTGKAAKEDEKATFWVDRVVHFAKPKSPPEDCVGEDCEICKRADKLMSSEDASDQEMGRRISAREQTVFLAYDVGADSPKPAVLAVGPSIAAPIFAFATDYDEYPDFLDYEEGRAVVINRDTTQPPSKMYAVTPAGKATEVPSAVLKQIDVSKFDVFGFGGKKKKPAEDDDEPEDEKEEPEETQEEEEEEEQEEVKTKAKSKKKKKKKKAKKEEIPQELLDACFGVGWEEDDDVCGVCKFEEQCKAKLEENE
jgi:hypothetical protein